ncbi:MAG TPA: hypothetical protein VNA69_06595 [Thermoanaerobaculia bacterium]|nr:hypothetical protein [Thermoanaerobaculia bacterium]
MACDHKGGPELIEMAEEHLRTRGESPQPGMRFRWSENLDGGMWASVIVEVERRADGWVVVRLDRRKEPVETTGFEVARASSPA